MTAQFEGLGYSDSLPFRFERLAELPDAATLAGINLENQQALVADASLDEQRPHGEKKTDEEHALAEDLQRVEFKINVLIQLVARLMQTSGGLPPARGVRLHATGLEWRLDEEEVQPGVGIVHLHLSRHFPQPMLLPGRIGAVREDADGRWLSFHYEGLSPTVTDLLERLIFRHHRRLVAGTRSAPRS